MEKHTGKTETFMNLRINGHRSDSKKSDRLAVDTHFGQPGHSFDRDFKLIVIEELEPSR